jgi:hypothetical protein
MNVYFIRAAADQIKIGKAADVLKRLRTIQVCCPHKLRIVGILPCNSKADANKTESGIHKKLAHLRLHGEWFIYNGESEKLIRDILKGGYVIQPDSEPVDPPPRTDGTHGSLSEYINHYGPARCARTWGVSRRTVHYWKNGSTVPQRSIQPLILASTGLSLENIYPREGAA